MTADLLKFFEDEFGRMDPEHQKRVKGHTKNYKQFRGIIDKDKTATKSRLFIQRTKVACIAGVANVADILFPSDDFFDVLGRNDNDSEGAEVDKKLLSWALRNGRFFHESVLYILQAAVYGTTFGKLVPYDVTEQVLVKEPITLGNGRIPGAPVLGYKNVYQTKTVKLVKLETVDVNDVWTDPAGLGIERGASSGLFQRLRRSVGYLRKMEKMGYYKNTKDLVKAIEEREEGKTLPDDRRTAVGLPEIELSGRELVLYEYSGAIPLDLAKKAKLEIREDEHEVEVIATMDEDFKTLLRVERNTNPNRLRNWVSDIWEPTADRSMYGRGIPENVRGSQQALNVTVNLRLDNKAWAIAAPLVVNLDKLASPETDLVARVNWVIKGRGAAPSEIAQFASIPDVTGSSTVEAQEFERHIDEESGMNKAAQATEGFGSNRTLGGISLAYSAATRPVRLIAKGFEDNLLAQGLKKIFMLLAARLDDEIVVRVTDNPNAPQFLKIDPLSLALDVDFVATGAFGLAERQQIVESMGTFFDFLSKVPALAQRPEWDWGWMAKRFYEAVGLKDFNKAWNPQRAMEDMMQKMQIQGMQGQLTAGGGAGAAAGVEGGGGPEAGVAGRSDIIEALAGLGRMAGGGEGEGPAGMAG